MEIKTAYGKAIIIEDEDGTRIDSLEIEKDHRGQGHGRELLVKAIEESKNITNELFIVADSKCEDFDNVDLVEFYESEGFDVIDCSSDCPILRMEF